MGTGKGTFDEQCNTLAEAISTVTVGGVITIKAGTTNETPTITKPLTIKFYNETAIVGE